MTENNLHQDLDKANTATELLKKNSNEKISNL